jgi:hypothetical protein
VDILIAIAGPVAAVAAVVIAFDVVLTTAPDESAWPDRSTWPAGAKNPGFGGHLSADVDQWRWSALQVTSR